MTLKFKRGTIISAKHDRTVDPYPGMFQYLIIVDKDGEEYVVNWVTENDADFFGEGDKVSFLLDGENVIRLRLNPFYKGE